MKNRLTHNLGMKILSIVFAAMLWLTVMNIANPVVTESFNNIPVQVINDEVITSRGYRYSIESGEKVSIRVKGKRSVLDKLTAADFVATADLNSMNSMYMATITVDCLSDDDDAQDISITLRNETMAIKLEDQETQPFGIRVEQTGSPKEGFYCYENKVSATLVQVTCSHSQMQEVKEIVATVDLEGKSASFSTTSELVAYDMSGNAIDLKKLSFSQDFVEISVGIYPTRTVSVEVVPENTPAEGYYVDKVEFAPATALISGDDQTLDYVSRLTIPCDVSGASATIDKQINIDDFLMNHFEDCYSAVPSAYVGIVITIKPMVEKILPLSEGDVGQINLDESLNCDISSLWGSGIKVRGPENLLDTLSASDLGLYLDLEGFVAGIYSIEVRPGNIEGLEIETGTAMVKITNKEAATEEE